MWRFDNWANFWSRNLILGTFCYMVRRKILYRKKAIRCISNKRDRDWKLWIKKGGIYDPRFSVIGFHQSSLTYLFRSPAQENVKTNS